MESVDYSDTIVVLVNREESSLTKRPLDCDEDGNVRVLMCELKVKEEQVWSNAQEVVTPGAM